MTRLRIHRLRHLRRLVRDRRGATIVEFGLVVLPLCLLLVALFDLGYRAYVGSVVEGTVHRAARLATIGDKTPAQIDKFVQDQLSAFSRNAKVTITKKSYSEFAGVGKAEKWQDTTTKGSPYNNGKYDAGVECFYDENKNGVYDTAATAGIQGLGGSDDIVYYSVEVTFPAFLPVKRLLGWGTTESVSSSTVMRNQPYGSQSVTGCTL